MTDADIVPAERWTDRIQEALHASDAILLILDPPEDITESQRQEWSKALQSIFAHPSKKLIPLTVGDTDLPPFLRSLPRIRIDSDHDAEKAASRLFEIIEQPQGAVQQLETPTAEQRDRWRRRVDELILATDTLRSIGR